MTVYSYSRISTFENCPLQYKLQYIDKITTEEEGVEAFMGSRVHETLEKLYADLILSRMNTVEELIEYYNEKWKEEWHEEVFINKENMTKEDYRKAGEKAIRDYYATYHPFDRAKTLWTERMVTFSLGDEDHRLKGVVDRLDKTPEGVLEIHDYKASQRMPTQEKMDRDRQLALYQIAVLEAYPDTENVELVWHYVLFDDELRSSRTKKQLEELKVEYIELIDEIEDEKVFPPKETALCDWCGYWEHCPAKKHLIKIEEMPAEERKKEKGYVCVDRYVELKEQVSHMADEIEDVKEQLINYAKENDVEVVRGTKKRARVSIRTETRLPSKSADEEAYEEMVHQVREAGMWDSESTLNTRKLARDLESGNLPEALAKQLKDKVYEEKTSRIYLSNLKEGDEPDE
ncbi:MAG: PD-(D/E)XK nuclease family protein [Thermoplasmata archaeon]|nr:MAG: PD-(D/E)XK nuclease family protein [Thermoplasmata archaeon]